MHDTAAIDFKGMTGHRGSKAEVEFLCACLPSSAKPLVCFRNRLLPSMKHNGCWVTQ